jgi:YfiH family protein
MTVIPITAAVLAGTRHGFLGRQGGVSTGIHAGLNVGLGSDDDPAAVAANRELAVAAVAPGATLVTVHQVHSAVAVTAPFSGNARPHADALVTDRPGLVLGILTADCVPILLADVSAGIIAAAHAGWKGALGGIAEATVAAMVRLGARPERIVAAIGPCIRRASYEVDNAFLTRFADADPSNERFFTDGTRAGHHQFDIEAYVAARLAALGLARIQALGLDTYTQPDRFYSYRRATHRRERDYGRQIALIAL